ncbi:hypothetical protein BDW60DRAFT_72708 [Aspergillus nidulans var. acristatus]
MCFWPARTLSYPISQPWTAPAGLPRSLLVCAVLLTRASTRYHRIIKQFTASLTLASLCIESSIWLDLQICSISISYPGLLPFQ